MTENVELNTGLITVDDRQFLANGRGGLIYYENFSLKCLMIL